MADSEVSAPNRPVRMGVLGGGQLGRMMGLAGIPLGLKFIFLDPATDACAGEVGTLFEASFDDRQAAVELAGKVDVATFDFENVPQESAEAFTAISPLYPPPAALGACQDRLVEKQILDSLGIGVAPHFEVSSRIDLLEGLERLGCPAVLKTRRFGYDGKGQVIIRDQEDLERAWQALGDHPLILEAFIPYDAECSVIGVRGRDGDTKFWPLTRNVHSDGILMLSLAGDFDDDLQSAAEELSRRVLGHFDYVGVLTLEFFLKDGQLIVNEMAPRVHNSGHWTIDGAATSQFENHVRAVAGLPLGSTAAISEALMFNWIGSMPDVESALAEPGLNWHDYGKQPRPGRKIGHATLVADNREDLISGARQLARIAGGKFPALLGQLPGF